MASSAHAGSGFSLYQPEDPLDLLKIGRIDDGKSLSIVAVVRESKGEFSYANLSRRFGSTSTDLHVFLSQIGMDRIRKEVESSLSSGAVETGPWSLLRTPFEGAGIHVAAGLTYADHKSESQVGSQSLLFVKDARPTPWNAVLEAHPHELLDYEIELGVYLPEQVSGVRALKGQALGFFLANDVTDRAIQIRKFQGAGTSVGFADSKSFPGALPVGPYVVFPRSWQNFYRKLQLNLVVNGVLRQQANTEQLEITLEGVVEDILGRNKADHWPLGKGTALPLAGNALPAGSLLLTGTPGGTIFQNPTLGFKIGSIARYIFFGEFASMSPEKYVKERIIQTSKKDAIYLKSGDEIESTISHLGFQKIKIR